MEIMRHLREPVWALNASASTSDAAVLLANTCKHHMSNWLGKHQNGAEFTIRLKFGAVTLRPRSGDLSVLYEVFAERAYEIPYAAFPPAGVATIVDCGAHIGLTALYFAHRYPHARVIAIEPNPANYELLVANAAQEPRITCYRACVSDAPGVARISLNGPSFGHTIGSRGRMVAAMTLDGIRDRFRIGQIDILKLDVEGMERAILGAGIGDVRAIVAELHGDYSTSRFSRDVAPREILPGRGSDTVLALPRQR